MKKKSGLLLAGIRFYPALLLCVSLLLIFFTCYIVKIRHSKIHPVHFLKNHTFDESSPIDRRTGKIPSIILDHMRILDGNTGYSGYIPDGTERKTISDSLELLPPHTKKVLTKRLIGIYFINDMLGSGLTNWVIDKKGNFYGYIVINPVSLKMTMSDYITMKENTCFKRGDDEHFSLRVDCGTDYTGFLYIILHESVHLVDYTEFLTPYVEEEVLPYMGEIPSSSDFTDKIWNGYDKPVIDYAHRKMVTFYGFSGGPKIPLSDSIAVYSEIEKTPFTSLYGSLNWAEDLAESVTFYHITAILKRPYTIVISKDGKTVSATSPMDRPKVRSRVETIRYFY